MNKNCIVFKRSVSIYFRMKIYHTFKGWYAPICMQHIQGNGNIVWFEAMLSSRLYAAYIRKWKCSMIWSDVCLKCAYQRGHSVDVSSSIFTKENVDIKTYYLDDYTFISLLLSIKNIVFRNSIWSFFYFWTKLITVNKTHTFIDN